MTRSVNPQVPGSSPGRGARIQKSPAFTGWAFCFSAWFGIGSACSHLSLTQPPVRFGELRSAAHRMTATAPPPSCPDSLYCCRGERPPPQISKHTYRRAFKEHDRQHSDQRIRVLASKQKLRRYPRERLGTRANLCCSVLLRRVRDKRSLRYYFQLALSGCT